TATPAELAFSAARAAGNGQECPQGPASSRSISDSGSCTRTSTSSSAAQAPWLSARWVAPVRSVKTCPGGGAQLGLRQY
ncbi:hypothetical protein Q6251_32745, partial [Klebsiella quasipneumoniae]